MKERSDSGSVTPPNKGASRSCGTPPRKGAFGRCGTPAQNDVPQVSPGASRSVQSAAALHRHQGAGVGVNWQTCAMTVDVAKLKRLRAAVSSALGSVPEKSAHGLPPTYNSLREQVAASVPEGLREELEQLAPKVEGSGRGPHAIIEKAQDGADAYARLAALKGWLDAVIDAG